jgi:hypothetical protein
VLAAIFFVVDTYIAFNDLAEGFQLSRNLFLGYIKAGIVLLILGGATPYFKRASLPHASSLLSIKIFSHNMHMVINK